MFTLSSNIDQVTRKLDDLTARQLPFAVSRALNDTAAMAKQGVVDEMRSVFDRPKPYTLSAFMTRPATKDHLVATVERKEQVVGRHYLEVEERGGARPPTGVEGLLASRVAYRGAFAAIVPAKGARLDQYGNWSTGQRNQVLSALGAQRDATANTTAASLKRKRNPSKYFVPNRGLAAGVYERTSSGNLKMILLFTTKLPNYEQRFDFAPAAEMASRGAFPGFFAQRMAEAVATTR